MVDVFISYARANQQVVRQLAEAVTRLGYSVWWDDELPPHLSYGEVITDTISEAKAAIVVWSEDAAASEWVRAEADLARNQKKLIQTSIDGRMPPMPFNQIQFASIGDWRGEDDHPGWTKVKASLLALCGAPGSPAPTPTARTVAAAPVAVPAPAAAAAPTASRRQPLLVPGLIGAAALAALGGFYLLWPHSPADTGTSANQVAANSTAAPTPAQQAAGAVGPAPGAEGTFTQAATIDAAMPFINLRGGPSDQAFIIGRVNRGDVFTTFPQQGGWWRVRIGDGTIGYLPHGQIRVMVPGAAPRPSTSTSTSTEAAPPRTPARTAAVQPAPQPAAAPRQPARPGTQGGPVPLQIQNMRHFCNGGPGAGTPQCIQFHQRMASQQMQRQ